PDEIVASYIFYVSHVYHVNLNTNKDIFAHCHKAWALHTFSPSSCNFSWAILKLLCQCTTKLHSFHCPKNLLLRNGGEKGQKYIKRDEKKITLRRPCR